MVKSRELTSVWKCIWDLCYNNHLHNGKRWLSLAELWYNSYYHFAIDCSPFKSLYGYEPNLGVIIVSFESHSSDTTVIDIAKDRAAHALMFKEQLTPTQNRMKLQADRQRVYPFFHVGEQVLLKLQPYCNTPCFCSWSLWAYNPLNHASKSPWWP
jgi:hypothetical protein